VLQCGGVGVNSTYDEVAVVGPIVQVTHCSLPDGDAEVQRCEDCG